MLSTAVIAMHLIYCICHVAATPVECKLHSWADALGRYVQQHFRDMLEAKHPQYWQSRSMPVHVELADVHDQHMSACPLCTQDIHVWIQCKGLTQ